MNKIIAKQRRHIIALTIIVLTLLSSIIPLQAANSSNANRMNVVFVIDASGSMRNTDKNMLRFEAIDLFLGLSTDVGNYIGAIVFDHTLLLKQDIKAVNGAAEKNELSANIREIYSSGDTNIGMAIEQATQMLNNSRNSSLDSAIILLSDGNTDFSDAIRNREEREEMMTASIASKEAAIATSQSRGYKIHSVCLNANGAADVAELQEISEATGGVCIEVKVAEDLKEIFTQFYDIIYSTETVELANTTIPENGELEVSFAVPEIGVEETNIIINTLNSETSYSLFKPDDNMITDDEMDNMTIKANTFSIIKIPTPAPGIWRLKVYGTSGDQIKIDMVYNTDLYLEAKVNDGNTTCSLNSQVTISAKFLGQGTHDLEVYQRNPIKAVITNVDTGKKEEHILFASASEAQHIFEPKDYGMHEIQVYASIDSINLASDIYELEVVNNKPTTNESVIEIAKLLTPFTDALYVKDLSQYISDEEDEILEYIIASSDYNESLVYIDGSNLNIMIKECKNGKLQISATDSQGASVSVEVEVKSISLVMILACILIPLAIVIAVILAVRALKIMKRVIRGKIQVSAYSTEGYLGSPETFEGGKGKMRLSRYVDLRGDVGINPAQTYLMASEKDGFIYMLSKTPYYTDYEPNTKSKKIKIDGNLEMKISADHDFDRFIQITYYPNEMY